MHVVMSKLKIQVVYTSIVLNLPDNVRVPKFFQ